MNNETTFATQGMDEIIAEARRLAAKEDDLAAHRLGNKPGARACNRSNYALGPRYQLQSLSITHEMVIDWLIANPGFGQMERCAKTFGCTRPWLSTLVHSDAFQAKLRDRKEQFFSEAIVPLKDKIVGVADRAVEKLGDAVEETSDPRMLLDVADKMLHKLGYAPKVSTQPQGPGAVLNTQNNYYAVSPELLAAAREKAKKGDLYGHRLAAPSPDAAPEELSGESGNTVGEACIESSAVLSEPEAQESPRREEAGDTL